MSKVKFLIAAVSISVLVPLYIWLLSVPDESVSFCVTDLEIVTSVEIPTGLLTCTTNGQIQRRYRLEGGYFSTSKDFRPKNNAFIVNRQALALLESEIYFIAKYEAWPVDFSGIIKMLESSLMDLVLYNELEEQRGALYLASYVGLSDELYPKALPPELEGWSKSLPILVDYDLGRYAEFFQTDNFLGFAICFLETDIPAVPFEQVMQSELIALCLESGRFKF